MSETNVDGHAQHGEQEAFDYLNQEPLFAGLGEACLTLEGKVWNTVKEAEAECREFVDELNELALEAALIGQSARLRSPKLLCPNPAIDMDGDYSIETADLGYDELEGAAELGGVFSGFTYKVQPASLDGREISLMTAKLCYQLDSGIPLEVPFLPAGTTMCVYADVRGSELTFLQDEEKYRALLSLEQLLGLDGADLAFIDEVNYRLSGGDRFEPKTLRYVGVKIEEILSGLLAARPQAVALASSALADLLKARLRLADGGEAVLAASQTVIRLPKNTSGGGAYALTNEATLYGKILDIGFAPILSDNQQSIRLDQFYSPSLIMEQMLEGRDEPVTVFVPMTHITQFAVN